MNTHKRIFCLSLLKLLFLIQGLSAFSDLPIFEKARIRAIEEGKFLYLDFHARWCQPCQWMEKNTYSNPEVLSLLNKEFVPLQINIDDIEGFELKNTFDIRYLPTIIIFDKNGKMIRRIEETMPPDKLLEVLNNTLFENSSTFVHRMNTSPFDIGQMADNVIEKSANVYRLQMGAFSTFESAVQEVNGLQEKFDQSIVIVQDNVVDKKLFKVVLGEFKSLNEALGFQNLIRERFQLETIVYR